MPKINVYLPDDLAEAVKEAGVPVSAICQRALEQAVRRVTAIRETTVGDLELDDPAAWRHFTPRARKAVHLGVEQARASGAANVGTEHLLAGILTEGTNLALHVLRAMEIEPDQVSRELTRRAPAAAVGPVGAAPVEDGAPVSPSQRFSGLAANALELAVTESHALGHNYIGCEHLLLGLVAEPEGQAGQVLRTLGAEPRLTRRAVAAALAGYVHLQAQGQGAVAAPSADTARMFADAVRGQMEPLAQRITRLEEHLGLTAEG